MLSKDRIMGTKEVADYLGMTAQAFTNMKNRYLEKNDFPLPFAELAATPIYDRLEIEKWADEHQRNYHAAEILNSWGEYKTIAFVGRPRVGKSFLVSLFVENQLLYRKSCSKLGEDFTQCAVQHIIKEDIAEPYAVFHNKRKDDKSSDTDGMDGLEFPLIEEVFPKQIDDITDYLRSKKNLNKKDSNNDSGKDISDEAYIEIFTRPSNMAKAIMKACNIRTLVITDTPGVSGNYNLVPIEKADLVSMVIADSGNEEAKNSYKELVEGLAPLIASSSVCFLYKVNESIDSEEEYIDLQKECESAMKSFVDYFESWKNSIVRSSMDVLQPEKNVLCIPSMKSKRITTSEEIFTKKIQEKIIKSLTNKQISSEEVKKILKKDQIKKNDAAEFVRELLNTWTTEKIQAKVEADGEKEHKGQEYTLENFKEEKHDRVKTGDNYRLLFQSDAGRKQQLKSLYNEFKKYGAKDYPEEWKQALIKFVYFMLTQGIKMDIGLVSEAHPFEDPSLVTMYVIESILAEDILNDVIKPHAGVGKYQAVLMSHGVTSNSWGYVKITETEEAVKKMSIINEEELNKIKVSNSAELVWSRYIMGLQKLAEYYIYETLDKIYE